MKLNPHESRTMSDSDNVGALLAKEFEYRVMAQNNIATLLCESRRWQWAAIILGGLNIVLATIMIGWCLWT